jgi:hypothetical protein
VQIVTKLTSEATIALRSDVSSIGLEPLQQLMLNSGVQLKPMHPSVSEGELAKFFVANVPDSTQATILLENLRKLSSVEGAYVTPTVDLPSGAT